MKKNLVMRIAAVVLMCTLVTACFASSTFAKYTSSKTLESTTATVAKWDVKVNDTAITGTDKVNFDLFKTIVDTKDGNTDANVATDRIAPGTKGQFAMKVTNASDVDMTYVIKLSKVSGLDLPIQYSIDGTNWYTLAQLNALDALKGTLDYAGKESGTSEKTVTVMWQWVFEKGADNAAIAANDASDTAIGIAGGSLVLNADIVATQVD